MNFSRYIGIPYKYKGRDFSGVDCYGLVYLIYKKEKNLNLPDFMHVDFTKNWYEDNDKHLIVDNINELWEIADSVKNPYLPFDCMLFYSSSSKLVVNHCGLYVGDNRFIHITDYKESKSELLRFSGYWESKLYKVLRYKGVVCENKNM